MGTRRYADANDTGRVVPGLVVVQTIGGGLIRWSKDGRYVYAASSRFGVSRVDLATGRAEPYLDLSPAHGSAITQMVGLSISDDPRRYVYAVQEYNSTLYVVRGAR